MELSKKGTYSNHDYAVTPFCIIAREREKERKKESERGILYFSTLFFPNIQNQYIYAHLYYKDMRAASERMLNYPNRQMLASWEGAFLRGELIDWTCRGGWAMCPEYRHAAEYRRAAL